MSARLPVKLVPLQSQEKRSDGRSSPWRIVERRVLSASAPYSASERLVAWAISSRMNKAGECWPSVADIAARTGLSPRTVQRALQTLCDGDHPLYHRVWDGGHRTPTYRLIRDQEPDLRSRIPK